MSLLLTLVFVSGVAAVIAALATLARRHGVDAPVPRALLGQEAVAVSELRPVGFVLLQGERWQAEAAGGPVGVGERVVVTAVEGLRLRVTPRRAPLPVAGDGVDEAR